MRMIWLFLAVLVGGGCGPGKKPPRSGPEKILQPDELVARSLQQQARLSSVHAQAAIRIVDRPSKFGLRVNAEIFAQYPDKLRIRATKLTRDAFDLVMLGEDIAFYVPRKRTLYRGKVKDLKSSNMKFRPDTILRLILRPGEHLRQKRWRFDNAARGPRPRFSSHKVVVAEIHAPGQSWWRATIHATSHRLIKMEHLNPKGEVVLIEVLGRYRRLKTAARGETAAVTKQFPYQIKFIWPLDQRSFEVSFKEIKANAPITDEDIEAEIPSKNIRIKPISAAEIDGDASLPSGKGDRRKGTP